MRRTKTLASLAVALVFALALGGYAYATPLNFESDISEDGVINVCNPGNVRPGMVTNAINQWNALSAQWDRPALSEVAGKNAFCEVTVERQGSPQANFYAQVVFSTHPDSLQLSPRFFTELSGDAQRAIITHEFGHILGLDHPKERDYEQRLDMKQLCAGSIMTTIMECGAVGVERRSTPGPIDETDLKKYWVDQRIYPKRKCWDSACSRWGPPASTFGASSRDGSPSRSVPVRRVVKD